MLNHMHPKISKYVFYPLWDLYDRSMKLREMRRLERMEREPFEAKRDRQWLRLLEIVPYAYKHCRFYAERGPLRLETWEDFGKLPILTKIDVRNRIADLISDQFNNEELIEAKTGGSTGVSLEIFFDKRTDETRNATALWTNRWSGWDLGKTVGALWGNPPIAETFKQRVRSNLLDRMIYLDTVRLDGQSMGHFVEQLRKERIQFLFGHAHSIFVFAKYVEAARLGELLDIRGIISTSMMLLPNERRTIERVFRCKVTNRYGCEEVGLIACECERHEGLHMNMDHLIVELLRVDGSAARPGEEAAIVVTDLINHGMPLLRYKVGDVGVLSDRECGCGRKMPLFERVVGRTADFLVRADGSLVAGVSLVERTLTAIAGLEQLQIVQDRRDEVVLNVVPDLQYSEDSERRLLSEMSIAFGGGVKFTIRKITQLEQEKNGKFRFSICRVGADASTVATESDRATKSTGGSK